MFEDVGADVCEPVMLGLGEGVAPVEGVAVSVDELDFMGRRRE